MTTKQPAYFFMCAFISSASLNSLCMENPAKFNPENTKFAFDFHDVIVTEPFSCLSDFKKLFCWNLIPTCNQHLPRCLYELLTCMFYGPTAERLKNICLQYKQETFITCVMDIGNSFFLIEETIDIMKELKEKGYELDLASNIDILFLNDLETNNKYAYIQRILALFTNKKSVDHLAIYSQASICKPDIRYFTEYQEKYNTEKKRIIFIDDKQRNITASEQTGMIGVQFKTPEQLRAELVKYGILK